MKKLFFNIVIFFAPAIVFGQGWISTKDNTINLPVESLRAVDMTGNSTNSRLRVAIGLPQSTLPSAKLHVFGSLRFDGLLNNNTPNRVLVTDASGNVFWRDISTLGGSNSSSNAWTLLGNAATSTDVLGTTNAQSMRLITNNTRRLEIDNLGRVGIGYISDTQTMTSPYLLNLTHGSMALRMFETSENIGIGDHLFRLFNKNGQVFSIASFQTLSTNSPIITDIGANYSINGIDGVTQYAVDGTRYAPLIRFNAQNGDILMMYENGTLATGHHRITQPSVGFCLNRQGYVGIQNPNPTANLDVIGTVRLQNLPSGVGRVLVIDNAGNVKISSTLQGKNAVDENKIKELEDKIKELEETLNQLAGQVAFSKMNPKNDSETKLYQSIPNPSKDRVTIPYEISDKTSSCKMMIVSLDGKFSKLVSINPNDEKVEINVSEMTNGVYFYSLLVNDNVAATRKLVVQY